MIERLLLRHFTAALTAVLVCVSTCTRVHGMAWQSDESVDTAVRALRAERILFKSDRPVYPAFMDLNHDSLPDLFLGSKGHDWLADEARTIDDFKRRSEGKQLSIHLNRSEGGTIKFAEPWWLIERTPNSILPVG